MPDWITDFVHWTEDTNSPEVFKLWSGISALAGAMERRIWIRTKKGPVYPNLFVFLVAIPGIGKSEIINKVNELWYDTKSIYLAPDNMTKASLIDELVKCDRKAMFKDNGKDVLVEYHSLAVGAGEWSVLCPSYDGEFLAALLNLYDNKKSYRETRRTMNKSIDIPFPQLNLLTGTQPKFIASTMPDEAWGMGFTSRLIMIYAGATPITPLFGENAFNDDLKKSLLKRLDTVLKMYGEVVISPQAMESLDHWYQTGQNPVPTHSRLTNYLPRRILHLLKLSTISCISRGAGMVVELQDVERAKAWLFYAENLMPNIFREMTGKSDSSILQELHEFLWRIFAKNRQPIPENVLYDFLMDFTVTDKIPRIMDVAEKSGLILKTISTTGVTMFSPRPKKNTGVVE